MQAHLNRHPLQYPLHTPICDGAGSSLKRAAAHGIFPGMFSLPVAGAGALSRPRVPLLCRPRFTGANSRIEEKRE
jgi:hypothetical protein